MDRERFINIVTKTHSAWISKGIKKFNLDDVLDFIESFGFDIPLVSVGSGNAFFEWLLCNLYPKLKIIMIDPEPFSFGGLPSDIVHYMSNPKSRFSYLETKCETEHYYKYTENLVKKRPSIVGNCNILLNWPDPNYNIYDYDSIVALKPRNFMAIFAPCGASGSEKFINLTSQRTLQLEDQTQYERKYMTSTFERESFSIVVQYELTVYQRTAS